jgi:NADPH2:quinone reductase
MGSLLKETNMRAWLLPGFSGVQSMTLGNAAEPVAGKGEVVLDVRFAAINPADRYLAAGEYPAKPAFPHILGRDGVGVVSAVGEGVKGVGVGDLRLILRTEVGVTRPGTLAERVAVPAEYTTDVPNGWSLEQAAAAPLVYVTAWQGLTQWGELKTANSDGPPVVLVTGASGGVGAATVHLANALGYTVIGLSRSEEKSRKLREMGAAITLDPQDKAWRKVLKDRLGARRVDLAIDNIGGTGFNELLEVMGMYGRISVVGRLAGPVPEFNTAALFFRRLKIGGVALSTYTNEEHHAAWRDVLKTLAKTGAKPLVDHVYAFDEVPAAFKKLEAGPMGKVVVKI